MNETARQRQKSETRERILRAAARQFGRHGFSLPTASIAKEAGVSHGAVFAHFSTREDLVDRVLEDLFSGLNRRIHEAAGQGGLPELLRLHLALLEESEGLYTHLVSQLSELPTGAQNRLFACQSTLSFHFRQALERERSRAPDAPFAAVPPHLLFNQWIALIHYYLQNGRMFAPEGKVLQRRGEELLAGYLALLGLEREERLL